jgi:hypothetical protein
MTRIHVVSSGTTITRAYVGHRPDTPLSGHYCIVSLVVPMLLTAGDKVTLAFLNSDPAAILGVGVDRDTALASLWECVDKCYASSVSFSEATLEDA